jgi:hypothetical protein
MKVFFKLALIGAVLMMSGFWLSVANAMPSYARQTGMDCNSCHIGFDSVPYFTRTGRLFIMRGFHQPNSVRGKLRETGFDAAGNDTPEYGGNYLALNWTDFWSMRMISTFISDSGGPNGKGKATSTPVSRISMFFTGPITDWLGLWTEIGYLGNNAFNSVQNTNAGYPTNLNVFADDEYRLTASRMIGPDSFIAAAFGSEYPDAINEFVFPTYLQTPFNYGQGGIGKEYETGAFSFYGFFHNHFFIQYSPITGDYDNSWSNGHNNYFMIAYDGIPGTGDAFNIESNDLWWTFESVWGNNVGSMVNPYKTSFICTGTCPAGITDSDNALSFTSTLGSNLPEISDLKTVNGTGIETSNNSDAFKLSVQSSVADRGNNSWYAAVDVDGIHQSYVSGAKAQQDGFGAGIRYFYNRTYGFEVGVHKDFSYSYWDSSDVKYTVSTPVGWNINFLWVPAMNMNIALTYSRSQPSVIYAADNPGQSYSYSLLLDYGF